MPYQTNSQALGRKAEDQFRSQLPLRWVFQQPTTDIGIDGLVVICDKSDLNGLEFRVQIKSSRRWHKTDGIFPVQHVKKSTLRYWFASPVPLMLVLYDHSTDNFHYVWHDELWDQITDLNDATGNEVSLKIGGTRELDHAQWNNVRQELHKFYSALADTFALARMSKVVFSAIRGIAESIKGLNFAHFAKPTYGAVTDEQEKLLLLMDVTCHRDAIIAVNELMKSLDSRSQAFKRLDTFVRAYTAEISTFVIPFDATVLQPDSAMAVRINAERMRTVRPFLIESLLNTICVLAGRKEMA